MYMAHTYEKHNCGRVDILTFFDLPKRKLMTRKRVKDIKGHVKMKYNSLCTSRGSQLDITKAFPHPPPTFQCRLPEVNFLLQTSPFTMRSLRT